MRLAVRKSLLHARPLPKLWISLRQIFLFPSWISISCCRKLRS
nr:MAG TPA: hypothetical protein [Bacteriophage sp.]